MNIKIAIIDIGISKNNKIKHFYLDNNQIVEGYKKPLDSHGNFVLKNILKQNIEFDILDINVTNYKGEPDLQGVILGIKKAIEERADIINISLGLTACSHELYKICQEAVENNIVIISAASHTGNISYPASFKNVLSVEINIDYNSKIKKIDESTLSVYLPKESIKIEQKEISLNSTSMAAAYFSGILGKDLSNTPIFDKFTILQKKYGINLDISKQFFKNKNHKNCKIYNRLKGKKVAVVIIPQEKFINIKKQLKLPNIVAIYNHCVNKFCDINNTNKSTDKFDTILIINTKEEKANISNKIKSKFKNYETIFVGNFNEGIENKALIYKYEDFINENLVILNNKPVILISALSSNLNKFDIQINLLENFKKDDVCAKATTYNLEGILYGLDVFEYPSKVVFPDIVCSINNYMYSAENNNDLDVWVINIGGGCLFINNQHKNIFGKLINAYLDACNVDIFILCINNSVDVNTLNSYIFKLKNMGIKEVVLIFIQNSFITEFLDERDELKICKSDVNFSQKSLKLLKEKMEDKIYTLEEVNNNELYEFIIETLTS